MVSSKNTFVPHTIIRRKPAPTQIELEITKRVSEIASLTLPTKKALKNYFSQTKWAQPRWAKYLSPLWGMEHIDVQLKKLAQELTNTELGFRFPESIEEYVSVLWITDRSIFGIITALRSEGVLMQVLPQKVEKKSRQETTRDTFAIGHRAKEDFLSMVWRYVGTHGDLSSTREHLIFTPNILRKEIRLHFQRSGLRHKNIIDFWQELLANTNITSWEENGWSYDITTSTLAKVQDGWSYIFPIPMRFFQKKEETPKNNTSSVEYFQKMLEEVKMAKWEFRALLEGILSASQGKSAPGTRWTKKPANYHLNLDWDNGFYVQLDGERRAIDIVYRVWHHRDLYYGKELLRNLREDQLSPCTISGNADRRIIEYTTENGWKMCFSLA